MTQMVVAEEDSSGSRTVVVRMKLDSHSRELLTRALVKVAQAGDWVITLHVLNNNDIADRDGKSSMLYLVKAFDSIRTDYEGGGAEVIVIVGWGWEVRHILFWINCS
ncbi:Protein kinase protein with adenine nucleotide alpha hydrolase-like domain [Abeliophyllum distichum]|uniref:Protein kinase protein with adenine nucleotide alpha hydrolase-like domain n=1 Tax=Abeliophyllum distichum TaxID=126358 RepID=A0ABD1VTV4_9LAMI